MYPGGYYSSYALSSNLCSKQSSSLCGKGGLWDPKGAQDGIDYPISYEPSVDMTTTSGLYMIGPIYAQNLIIGTGGTSATVPNASISAVDIGNITLPNGNQIDLEVGALALGADDQQQVFTTGSDIQGQSAIDAWIFPGYLYNKSIATSYSFTLQLGSTAFAYPGSMIYGGYDKGRAIGPGTTYGDTSPQLLDITLGVETGGSPFKFGTKDSLLINNVSAHDAIQVTPEPLTPYLNLPKQTCDNLAKYLPIKFDSSGYYLWDTSDPSYVNITTSAAYLGFEFPPATGGTENVIIKVPMQLLVLNLTQQASSRVGLTPYFPCMPYETTDGGYLLGRAFLQAAFWGRNWNQHVSWLAQAPGPGSLKAGLGHQPMDIENSATTLDFYSGGTYLKDSWSEYWSPLPGGTDDETTSSGSNSNNNSGLTVGAQAGIGAGVGVAGIALIAVLAFFLFRRRKNNKDRETKSSVQESSVYAHHGDPSVADPSVAEPHLYQGQYGHQQPPHSGTQSPSGYQPPGFGDSAYEPPKSTYQTQNPHMPMSGTITSPAELSGWNPTELEAPGPKFVRQASR